MVNQPRQGSNPFAPPTSDVNFGAAPAEASDSGARLAERGSRLGAELLDGLLYVLAALPAIIFAITSGSYFKDLMGANLERASLSALVEWARVSAFLGGICVLGLAIYQWVRIATTGQTIGKQWLAIKVVKLDGSPVGFFSGVVMRSWVRTLLAMLLGGAMAAMRAWSSKNSANLFTIVDALFIFGASRRCLHDYLAGTKVVVAS